MLPFPLPFPLPFALVCSVACKSCFIFQPIAPLLLLFSLRTIGLLFLGLWFVGTMLQSELRCKSERRADGREHNKQRGD